jgi:hypothetical protein
MQSMSQPGVRWGEWIGEGWEMFANQWQVWVVNTLVMFLIIMIPVVPIYILMFILQLAAANSDDPSAFGAFFLLLMPVMYIGILLTVSYLFGGAHKTALKQLRGERIELRDLFSGGPYFLRICGAVLLIGILASIGGILCIFPAFIVAGLLMFTIPLIIDRNMGVIDAMKASVEATKGDWLMFALFALVLNIIASSGAIVCGIGALVSYPLFFTINSVAYRDRLGMAGAAPVFRQEVPPPSAYAQQTWTPPSAVPPPPTPSVPQPGQEAVICPRCGSRSASPTAKFCNVCGSNLRG